MRRLLNTAHRGLHRIAASPHGHAHTATRDPGGMGINGKQYDRLSGRLLSGLYRRAAGEADRAPRGGVVADIGTGPGRLLLAIAGRRPDLEPHGIDVSPDMVERARHNAAAGGFGDRITVHLADAAHLPLGDGAADLVVSTLSMHHWGDVPAAVREVARVLRPGGRFVVYDFRAVPDTPLTGAVATAPEFAGARVERTLVSAAPWIPFPLFARLSVERPAGPSGTTAVH